jgi:hypothetical protein
MVIILVAESKLIPEIAAEAVEQNFEIEPPSSVLDTIFLAVVLYPERSGKTAKSNFCEPEAKVVLEPICLPGPKPYPLSVSK